MAVIVTEPSAIPVAFPFEFTVAKDSSEDVQVNFLSVAFSGKMVASNWKSSPIGRYKVVSFNSILSTATLAFTIHLPHTSVAIAYIFTLPDPTPVTKPFSSTVARDSSEDLHTISA